MSASYHPVWLFGTNAERLAWIAAHAGSNPGEEDGLGGIYWWETDTGELYIWDVDNGAWVHTTAGGAPANAQYLTLAVDATLTNERVFVDGTALTGTDGGAGGNYTLDLDIPSLTDETGADDADSIAIYDSDAAAHKEMTRANFLGDPTAMLNAEVTGFIIKNTSGGAVSANDLGYIDEAGEFKTTGTAYSDVAWAIVLVGGADNADVYVARRGRVTVALNGDCSVGDYLYTSTSAGQAQPQSYVRPELFAVALTANGSGAGGTCEALLLCERKPYPYLSSENIILVSGHSGFDFNATIATLPGGATLTYTVGSGNEDSIDPAAATELGKIVLHNTTRGDSALIDDVNTGTNTVTLTAAVPGTWQVSDSITARSQTNSDTVFSAYFYDIDLSSADNTDVPMLAVMIVGELRYAETGGASNSQIAFLHPFEAGVSAKRKGMNAGSSARRAEFSIPLIQQRFQLLCSASGSGTATISYRVTQILVAAP